MIWKGSHVYKDEFLILINWVQTEEIDIAADREDLRENDCVKESEESDQRLLLLQICSRGVEKVVELLDITNISLSYIYLMENY